MSIATVDPLERVSTTEGLTLDELMTAAWLADRHKTSTSHLANLRAQGRGVRYLKLSGSIRYRLSDVLAAEAEAEVAPAGAR